MSIRVDATRADAPRRVKYWESPLAFFVKQDMKTTVALLMLMAQAALPNELTRAGQQAFDSLKTATVFRFGNGLSPGVSPAERSVIVLLQEKSSPMVFQELLETGSVAAQLYALTVQRVFEPDRFQKSIRPYLQMTNQVEVMEGCILYAKPVSQIAREIGQGRFDAVWPKGSPDANRR